MDSVESKTFRNISACLHLHTVLSWHIHTTRIHTPRFTDNRPVWHEIKQWQKCNKINILFLTEYIISPPRKKQKLNSLQLHPNSSSTCSSSASAGVPGISVSMSVSVSPTWGSTGRRRTGLLGDGLAASRFAGCHATDEVGKWFISER